MAEYPEHLPFRIQYDMEHDLVPEGAVAVSDFDSGDQRVRNRFTNIPSRATVQMAFTDLQYEAFKHFYLVDLANGIASFTKSFPVGMFFQDCRLRFIPGSLRAVASTINRWIVTAEIEIRTMPIDGTGIVYALFGPDIDYMDDKLQLAVNVKYYDVFN